jgi:transposase
MRQGEVLLWDQLGKSGRCLHPIRQHFNSEVIEKLKRKGVKVIHLPPKGKYLNPLELLFSDLKEHYIRPQFPRSGRDLSKKELKGIIRNYMDNLAPRNLYKFFRARANGRELIQNQLL